MTSLRVTTAFGSPAHPTKPRRVRLRSRLWPIAANAATYSDPAVAIAAVNEMVAVPLARFVRHRRQPLGAGHGAAVDQALVAVPGGCDRPDIRDQRQHFGTSHEFFVNGN